MPTRSALTFISEEDNRKEILIADLMEDTILTKEHVIQLSDLKPNTKYYYSVSTNSKIVSKGENNYFENPKILATGKHFYFTTALSANDNSSKNIWTMGDFGDNTKLIYITNQTEVRDQYLKNKPNYTDLWLLLGNNAYCWDTGIEYQKQIFDFMEVIF